VKTALSAMTVKTDRKDARGIAQLLRMAWFQPVHAKSIGSQEIRALLVARKQLLGRLVDVELSIRGILRGFGLKVRGRLFPFRDQDAGQHQPDHEEGARHGSAGEVARARRSAERTKELSDVGRQHLSDRMS
jgi:transposase